MLLKKKRSKKLQYKDSPSRSPLPAASVLKDAIEWEEERRKDTNNCDAKTEVSREDGHL